MTLENSRGYYGQTLQGHLLPFAADLSATSRC